VLLTLARSRRARCTPGRQAHAVVAGSRSSRRSRIDCQSRKDVMNFWEFDPVAGLGVEVGPCALQSDGLEGALPRYAVVRVHVRIRWTSGGCTIIHHGQRSRAVYDFSCTCGPVPAATWARDARGDRRFGEDVLWRNRFGQAATLMAFLGGSPADSFSMTSRGSGRFSCAAPGSPCTQPGLEASTAS
jgi:hypothetical protein